jgi:hypothetical protein
VRGVLVFIVQKLPIKSLIPMEIRAKREQIYFQNYAGPIPSK